MQCYIYDRIFKPISMGLGTADSHKKCQSRKTKYFEIQTTRTSDTCVLSFKICRLFQNTGIFLGIKSTD